jgi:hypothetical protein
MTTQLLVDYFYVDKILHYDIAGGADASSNLGDVSIASEWATWGPVELAGTHPSAFCAASAKRTSSDPSLPF